MTSALQSGLQSGYNFFILPVVTSLGNSLGSAIATSAVSAEKETQPPVLHPLITLVELGLLWDRSNEQLKIRFANNHIEFVDQNAFSTKIDKSRSKDDLIYLEPVIEAALEMYPPTTLKLKIIYLRAYKGLQTLLERYSDSTQTKTTKKLIGDVLKRISCALTGLPTREEKIMALVRQNLQQLESLIPKPPPQQSDRKENDRKFQKEDPVLTAIAASIKTMKLEFEALIAPATLDADTLKWREDIKAICNDKIIDGFNNDYELALEKLRKQEAEELTNATPAPKPVVPQSNAGNASGNPSANASANAANASATAGSGGSQPASPTPSQIPSPPSSPPTASAAPAKPVPNSTVVASAQAIIAEPSQPVVQSNGFQKPVKIPKELRSPLESRIGTCLAEFQKLINSRVNKALKLS